MALYEPHAQQNYAAFAHFFVRTRGAPETMARKVEETLAGLDFLARSKRQAPHVFRGRPR
jgi:hypothetical protein